MKTISAVLFFVYVFLYVGCQHSSNLLDEFHSFEAIKPIDSINLSKFGILAPGTVSYQNDFLIFKNRPGIIHHLSFFDLKNKSVFEKIRKGQGPNEVINLSILQTIDKKRFSFFDLSKRKIFSLDLDSLRENKEINQDEIVSLDSVSLRLTQLIDMGDCIIGSGIISKGRFVLYKKKTKEVSFHGEYPIHEKITPLSYVQKGALFSGTRIIPKPDGTKFVCLINGLMEIYDVNNDSINLSVKKYFHFPDFFVPEERQGPVIGYKPSNIHGYFSADADNEYIYAIYTNKSRENSDLESSWNCNDLLVYDWNGNPVKWYRLSSSLTGIAVNNKVVYGINQDNEDTFVHMYNIE